MDRERLENELEQAYDTSDDVGTVVARQARDLADSGLFEAETGRELTTSAVLEGIGEAPEEYDLAERWNWWLESLELVEGSYERFSVRSDIV